MRVNAKYKLTDVVKIVAGHTLRQIEAVRDFGTIKSGFVGGWIEAESNLDHEGNAWVKNDACVFGNARVFGDALVDGAARVFENACVYGNAVVTTTAKMSGNAHVYGNSIVCGNAEIKGNATVYESAMVYGDAIVYDDAIVRGSAVVCGNAGVSGRAIVCGNAMVCGNAKIKSSADYVVFKNTWTSNQYFTYTKSNKQWIVGGFYGSGDDLVQQAYEVSELSGRCFESIVRAQEEIEKAVNEFAE